MNIMLNALVVSLLALLAAFADDPKSKPQPPPAEQYKKLVAEFGIAARGLWTATNDDERRSAAERGARLPPKFMELAEKNPQDPMALDALVQVLTVEIWLANNTTHPGLGKNSAEARAIAQLLRHHVRSDQIYEACRRARYGFRKECETFLRSVLEKNPHKDVQAQVCLMLAQFLNSRLQRIDLLKEQPEMIRRYEGLFGKEYLETSRRQDRAAAIKEIETIFERAAAEFGDVKMRFGGTIGEKARSELYEIRQLAIGKQAPEIEGPDQDGKRFKLSDYRGKVVLIYFWSEI